MTATIPAQRAPYFSPAGRYDGPRDLDGFRLSKALSEAGATLPSIYHDSPGNVLVAIQKAIALDVPVATALDNFVFSQGKSGMKAQLMHALILRAGHKITVLEHTNKRVAMRLERCDGRDPIDVEWKLTEARRAGLLRHSQWQQYPGDCLWARCLSRLARRGAADVVHGMGYVVEEIESMTDGQALEDSGDETPPESAEPATDVIEILRDVDVLTADELRARRTKAKRAGLLEKHAGYVAGERVTVLEVLNTAGVAAAAREAAAQQAAASDSVAAVSAAERAADSAQPADGAGDETAPAGEGTAGCGCPMAELLETGDHREGCEERTDDGDRA